MTATISPQQQQSLKHSKPSLWDYLNGAVLRRAAVIGLILGTLLTLSNQPDAVFGSAPVDVLPVVLVYMTPFLVAIISQLLGIRRAVIEQSRRKARQAAIEPFWLTIISDGIPMRGLLVGLAVGGTNTVIVAVAAIAEFGTLVSLPLPLLAQTLSIPIVFSMLAQAIAYRRAIATTKR